MPSPRREGPCPTSPPVCPITHWSVGLFSRESQLWSCMWGWALAKQQCGPFLRGHLGPSEAQQPLCFPLPSYVFGGTGSFGHAACLNVTSQAEMPSLSSFSCFLAARCNYSVSCLQGLRAWGEIGLEKDRAFSPKLLVLPGGVPLK